MHKESGIKIKVVKEITPKFNLVDRRAIGTDCKNLPSTLKMLSDYMATTRVPDHQCLIVVK